MMTRRTFVGALALTTAAGSIGLGSALIQKRRLAAHEIAAATVKPLQGQNVKFESTTGARMRAVVQDVTTVRRPARWGAPATEQISICLVAEDSNASAGSYRIQSDVVNLDELYFSPVDAAGSDRRLEAVITRIV